MKRSISILLIVAIVFTVFLSSDVEFVRAAGTTQYKPLAEITEDDLRVYALNFAAEFFPGNNFDVQDYIPVYDEDDIIIGYSLSYYDGNTPYGYITLNFTKTNPVVDFALAENARCIYDYLVDNITSKVDVECSRRLYLLGFDCYSIEGIAADGTAFILNSITGLQEIVSSTITDILKHFLPFSIGIGGTSASYNSLDELFLDTYEPGGMVTNAPTYTSKYDSKKSMLTEEYIMKSTNTYACAVVALTEIANQEGVLKNNSIIDTYNDLWDKTDTEVYKTIYSFSRKIECGSTPTDKLADEWYDEAPRFINFTDADFLDKYGVKYNIK